MRIMPLIRNTLLAIVLCLATTAQAQQGTVTGQVGTVNPEVVFNQDWESLEERAKLSMTFDGAQMTNTRAAAIAASEGFDFISWQTCPSLGNCMILEVQGGQRDGIFRYVVLGERCQLEVEGRTSDNLDISPPLTTSRRASGPVAPSTTVTPPVAAPPIAIEDDETGNASGCFGNSIVTNYMVAFRMRQHNTFITGSDGEILRLEAIYQAISNGRWTTFATSMMSEWVSPIAGTGSWMEGRGHSWRDAAGDEVAGNVEEVIAQPGSGDSTVTAANLCGAQRDAHKAKWNVLVELNGAACLLVPIPTSITVGGDVAGVGAPGGVGGVIKFIGSVTKSFDYCATTRNIGLAVAANAAEAEHLDCLQNPGRYFPNQFQPVPDALSLEDVLGFEPLTVEAAPKACVLNKTETWSVQAGGLACTTTVKSVCTGQAPNCNCKVTGDVKTVCTEP